MTRFFNGISVVERAKERKKEKKRSVPLFRSWSRSMQYNEDCEHASYPTDWLAGQLPIYP